MDQLEAKIEEWRDLVAARPGVDELDAAELEAHLRDQIADLEAAELTADEAFLIAVQRVGNLNDVSREYAREHRDRLWKQLVVSPREPTDGVDRKLIDGLAFGVASAVTVAVVFGLAGYPDDAPTWLLRNTSLLVLPWLVAYFAWRRRLAPGRWATLAAAILVPAVVINAYPFADGAATEVLAAGHLVAVLWFVVASAYVGGGVGTDAQRMDFVRFTGEWVIYYTLLAIGGAVLVRLSASILEPASVDVGRVAAWVLPIGAAGAVVVAAWLVEAKQQMVENIAPVLTTVFTPLFALMVTIAALLYATAGLDGEFDRELVVVFDVLMVVVLGLVLFDMSARGPSPQPGWKDRVQLVAVGGALVLDVVVLAMMFARVGDLGFTPNRAVALGLNMLLLANLAGTMWWSVRFLTGRSRYRRLVRWQTSFLPLFAAWAAAVVVVVPVLFDFS